MTFHLRLNHRAQRDIDDIVEYLDATIPEQTNRFLDDLDNALHRVRTHPTLRAEVRPGVRHESLTRFRYHLWYRTHLEIQLIEIFAVLHHRRGPRELTARLPAPN